MTTLTTLWSGSRYETQTSLLKSVTPDVRKGLIGPTILARQTSRNQIAASLRPASYRRKFRTQSGQRPLGKMAIFLVENTPCTPIEG